MQEEKTLDTYNVFSGFTIVESNNGRYRYSCDTCSSIIERTQAHVNTAEYLVCEKCSPRENFGARLYTEYGYFDSAIEYESYKILLKYFNPEQIIRQKKYTELFSTGTKHTADFYIPHIPIVLEVTSKYNKIGTKYKETAEWKKSLSNIVIFAYTLKEVEDIVRPLSKDSGLSVQVPLISNNEINIPLIAGNPLNCSNYKVTSNSELECSKIDQIGQSAAKLPIGKEERSETIREE